MKKAILIIGILIIFTTGCAATSTDSISCAKCGGTADGSTVTGTLSDLTEMGCDPNDCHHVSGNIYSAVICRDCLRETPIVDEVWWE